MVFVAGQHGAGKSAIADLVQAALDRRGSAVRVCSDLCKSARSKYGEFMADDVRTDGSASAFRALEEFSIWPLRSGFVSIRKRRRRRLFPVCTSGWGSVFLGMVCVVRFTRRAGRGRRSSLLRAHRMVPHGRVLVLVPTLALLSQTVREWREFGHAGPMVAVCAIEDNPQLHYFGVPSTTSAPQLALRWGKGPVTVFATYASLPVLIEAHEGLYGLPMDMWDLVAMDEAHRSSGHLGKAWAVVHDQEQVPAMRRLYLTATPRIWMERPPRRRWERDISASAGTGADEGAGAGSVAMVPVPRDPLPEEMACSMDDEAIYGPVLWSMALSDAIARGL